MPKSDKMLDFTDIKYQNLIEILKSGTCVFFGAGISKLAGYRLWEELKYGMVDYFWGNRKKISFQNKINFDFSMTQNLKNHTDIIEAFDYLYFLDRNLFDDGIREIFTHDGKNENTAVYHELSKLNNKNNFFITTNIDRGFERYLGIDKNMTNVFPNFDNERMPLLTYLHGRIDDNSSWVFTRNQYHKAYLGESQPCTKVLKKIFERHSVLFIGYGLMDMEIKQAILMTSKRKAHYWLEATSRNTEDSLSIRATTLKENYNIELISYSIDGGGHYVAIDLLNRLHSAVEKR